MSYKPVCYDEAPAKIVALKSEHVLFHLSKIGLNVVTVRA